jgi:hypothetical protein
MFFIYWSYDHYTSQLILEMHLFIFPLKYILVLLFVPGCLLLELLHTHLGFIFPKVIPYLLFIISHYPISYILGENIPPGEYSLSVDNSV